MRFGDVPVRRVFLGDRRVAGEALPPSLHHVGAFGRLARFALRESRRTPLRDAVIGSDGIVTVSIAADAVIDQTETSIKVKLP
ncbi:hypothetical protein AN189_18150 [Loktanella sp. 3ANDIMAR09]|nr:hypothetical protein AN189_18150 [Loktanella sp. 3ANDIMAR09]